MIWDNYLTASFPAKAACWEFSIAELLTNPRTADFSGRKKIYVNAI